MHYEMFAFNTETPALFADDGPRARPAPPRAAQGRAPPTSLPSSTINERQESNVTDTTYSVENLTEQRVAKVIDHSLSRRS